MNALFSDKPFKTIINTRLHSVCFMTGYVCFPFAKATFEAFMWPTIMLGDKEMRSTDAGYKDALCTLIGKDLTAARAIEDVGISLFFEGGATLFVSLRPGERNPAGETAMLSHVPDIMWVW